MGSSYSELSLSPTKHSSAYRSTYQMRACTGELFHELSLSILSRPAARSLGKRSKGIVSWTSTAWSDGRLSPHKSSSISVKTTLTKPSSPSATLVSNATAKRLHSEETSLSCRAAYQSAEIFPDDPYVRYCRFGKESNRTRFADEWKSYFTGF